MKAVVIAFHCRHNEAPVAFGEVIEVPEGSTSRWFVPVDSEQGQAVLKMAAEGTMSERIWARLERGESVDFTDPALVNPKPMHVPRRHERTFVEIMNGQH